MPKNILIMAGGTGGHVFPAIAVAQELQSRGYNITWLGTRKGIESTVVVEKGFPIHFIRAVGVRGKNLVELIKAPFIILLGLMQAIKIIAQLRPVSVLGMGGFVSVPGGIACWLMRKPLVLHEQNAVAGTANRLLSRFATKKLQGFEGAFDDGVTAGNPVRKEISVLADHKRDGQRSGKCRLLVVGGSLGALAINKVMPDVIKLFDENECPEVLHQTGKATYEETIAGYAEADLEVDGQSIKVQPFIEDMAAAYQWADIIVCRAGAITTAEIACVGVPAIFIPFPYATDDHQKKNADYFVSRGAALVIDQQELKAVILHQKLLHIFSNTKTYASMSTSMSDLANPLAASRVADFCEEVANG